MDDVDLHEGNPLLAALPASERATLAGQMVQRSYERDEYLFFEGDPAEWLLIVGRGRVKMVKQSESGRETILATFGPGQVVGEVGVLVGETYPATAQAMEPTLVLSLRRADYVVLVRRYPDVAWAVIGELGRRLQQAHETIRSLAVEKVERRIARVLLRLASTAGERAAGGAVRLTVVLTRQDLADMAGTVIETAIRIMSKFQKQGLVDTQEGYIVLLRPHELVAIAEEL